MLKLKLTLLLFFIYTASFSQTTSTIDKLDSSYQSCLDKGMDMYGCSLHYYNQMDSMLNIVYKQLRAKKDSSQKIILKSKQLKWLSARDKYFKQVDNEPSNGLDGNDRRMAAIDKKALYVEKRVIELIKELEIKQ